MCISFLESKTIPAETLIAESHEDRKVISLIHERANEERRREWDFCDQCIFYIACHRVERKKGEGCEVFEPYPYERDDKFFSRRRRNYEDDDLISLVSQ